jgi:CRISPR-associated protein Csx16
MSLYFVSRHPGAIEWLQGQFPGQTACVIPHMADQPFDAGDMVCGVLPIALAARLCRVGALPVAIEVDLPAHLRGQELSAAQLDALGARLVCYDVQERLLHRPDQATSALVHDPRTVATLARATIVAAL